MTGVRHHFTLLLAALACPTVSNAQMSPMLADHSIEQLMDIRVEVTSAARKPQRLEDTAAAIHVITREDIRRAGLTSLPEVLRLVPGLQVARIDGGTWAISSRGFNAKNSDNLLVMQDGRVLHTPTFTGVYWNAQDVVLEDVDRIEVIRGSGGALWGANAVTGIINIVTRPARATQGGMADIVVGSHERQGVARYGGRLGESGHFRFYAKRTEQDDFGDYAGIRANDRRDMNSAGFRTDWALVGGNSLTVQGDLYEGRSNHTGTAYTLFPYSKTSPYGYPIDLKGGNLLARWTRALSVAEEWSFQAWFDHYDRQYYNLGEQRDTLDLDFQHRFVWNARHDIVWGLGYRRTNDDMRNTDIVSYTPARRTDSVASAFFQDEIALIGDDLHLIAGTKIERNDYTGTEIQPNLRLRWKIDERSMAWAAASRAVHTPSRTDVDGKVVSVATSTMMIQRVQGNSSAKSEKVDSLEAGWRAWPTERLQMDISTFVSRHRDLSTIETGASFAESGYTVIPLVFNNKAKAMTRGVEWCGNWRPDERWQFKASYTWLSMSIHRNADSTDNSIEGEEGRSPRSQFQVHAFHSPTARLDWGVSLYHVNELPSLNVPAYTRLDARIAWRVQRDVELSLTARNLLDPGHPEFTNTAGPRTTEVPRSLLATATWRF